MLTYSLVGVNDERVLAVKMISAGDKTGLGRQQMFAKWINE